MISFKTFLENQATAMPPWIYHVTPDLDAIMRTGHFMTAQQQGIGKEVMGGASTDAVSFTTEHNAQSYQEGLEIYRHAAQGYYDWNDVQMMYAIAERYGLSWQMFDQIRQEMQKWMMQSQEKRNEHIVSEYLSKISFYSFLHSRKVPGTDFLPLVLRQGGAFPARLKNSKGIAIVAISPRPGNGKPGPQQVQWVATEQEWKIRDPQNFDYTTLKVVSKGLT